MGRIHQAEGDSGQRGAGDKGRDRNNHCFDPMYDKLLNEGRKENEICALYRLSQKFPS